MLLSLSLEARAAVPWGFPCLLESVVARAPPCVSWGGCHSGGFARCVLFLCLQAGGVSVREEQQVISGFKELLQEVTQRATGPLQQLQGPSAQSLWPQDRHLCFLSRADLVCSVARIPPSLLPHRMPHRCSQCIPLWHLMFLNTPASLCPRPPSPPQKNSRTSRSFG